MLEREMQRIIRADDINVEVIFTSGRMRVENDKEQFSIAIENWDDWKNNNFDKLSEYIDRNYTTASQYGYDSVEKLNDVSKWFELQEFCEQYAISLWKNWDRHLDIKEIDKLMPIFLWIRDRVEAVFVLMSYDDNVVAYAFYTSYSGLIDALESLARRYKRHSNES